MHVSFVSLMCGADACFLWIWCYVCVFVFLVVGSYMLVYNIYSMRGSCMFSYVCSYVLMFFWFYVLIWICVQSQALYLCLVWCVGNGWAPQGPRHGRFQLLRLGLLCMGVSGPARGCGAIAMAGGSAFARLCAIANLCEQRSTTGEQRRVAERRASRVYMKWFQWKQS